MLKEFRDFVLRGNVVELAVAVVMGAAFTAVVNALVKDLITPFIAAIVGAPDFSAIATSLRHSGHFLVVGSDGASPRRNRAISAFTGRTTKK